MTIDKTQDQICKDRLLLILLCRLLDEHAALIAGCEDSDNMEVQVLEEAIENICDQYETAPEDTTSTDCDNQSMITDEDNTIDCDDDDASEPSHPLVADMNPWKYEMKAAASLWAFNESDEDDSFSEFEHDSAAPLPSLRAAEDSSQGDDFLLRPYIHSGPAKPPLDVTTVDLPLHATTVVSRSDPSRVSLLKELPIDDFLFKRGKENLPPQTVSCTQPSPPQHHNAVFSHSSSEMKTPKHGRSGQAKVDGFAASSTEGNYVESFSKDAASDDDDDFMPS